MSEVIDKFRALAEAAGLQGVAPEGEATIVTKRELLEAADQLDALTAENQALRERVKALEEGQAITKETSDGYHTFGELYDYRRVYNALLFNEWAKTLKYDVHKSWRHSDGEFCFGGGWFIVVAQLPYGQISNHYKAEFWHEFAVPEREIPAHYDGHTPQTALARAQALLEDK